MFEGVEAVKGLPLKNLRLDVLGRELAVPRNARAQPSSAHTAPANNARIVKASQDDSLRSMNTSRKEAGTPAERARRRSVQVS